MCEDEKKSNENDCLTCIEFTYTYAFKPLCSRHFLGTHNAKGGIDLRFFLVLRLYVNNENT
jgi:hypothetical protein